MAMNLHFQLENSKDEDKYNSIFMTIFNLADKASLFKKKNGELDLKEFTRVIKAIPKDSIGTDASENIISDTLFNMIDVDHSGYISKSEFTKFCKQMNKGKGEIKETFSRMDVDNSGNIDKDEFAIWFFNQK